MKDPKSCPSCNGAANVCSECGRGFAPRHSDPPDRVAWLRRVQAKNAAEALLACDPELAERCQDGIGDLEPADLEAIAARLLELLDDKA